MTKIRAKKDFEYDGEQFKKGEEIVFPQRIAEELVEAGYATEVVEPAEAKETGGAPEQEEGVNVQSLLPGGAFLSHGDVEEGDRVEITGSGEVDESFDQNRLVLPVEYRGKERRVSLGPENIERISEEFGLNTKNWVGERIEVALIKKYKGLGKKGIVWKPVEE